MNDKQITAEQGAGRVYKRFIWAFFPYMLIFAAASALLGSAIIAMLLPSAIFLILIRGLNSPYLFVRRHTQQAFILAAAAMAALWLVSVMEITGDTCLGLFPVVAVWFGGGFVGLRQVREGDCWLMKKLDGDAQLPRPWDTNEDEAAEETVEEVAEENVGRLLEAFRKGTAEERQHVVGVLERMGEVELF